MLSQGCYRAVALQPLASYSNAHFHLRSDVDMALSELIQRKSGPHGQAQLEGSGGCFETGHLAHAAGPCGGGPGQVDCLHKLKLGNFLTHVSPVQKTAHPGPQRTWTYPLAQAENLNQKHWPHAVCCKAFQNQVTPTSVACHCFPAAYVACGVRRHCSRPRVTSAKRYWMRGWLQAVSFHLPFHLGMPT